MLCRSLICLAVLGLTGCDATDPYSRDGMWRPNGANEANLRAMVVSPADLARGVESPGGDGQQAAAALDRQRNDKVRRLHDSAVAKVVPVSSGSGTQQGGQ
jgi:type IV pilus biogenesis protein CpaD/CtpE